MGNEIRSRHTPEIAFRTIAIRIRNGRFGSQAPTPPAATPAPAAKPAPAVSTAASPKVETPEPPDKVVLKVGDQQFTKADMDLLIKDLPPAIAARHSGSGDEILWGMVCANGHALPAGAPIIWTRRRSLFVYWPSRSSRWRRKPRSISKQGTREEIQQYYTAHAADDDEILVRQIIVDKKPPVSAAPGQSTSPACRVNLQWPPLLSHAGAIDCPARLSYNQGCDSASRKPMRRSNPP